MKRSIDELIVIARQIVLVGNEVIRDTRPQVVTEKSDRDTYTDVDILIERKIRSHLATITPEIDFIGEEEQSANRECDSDYTWILDPIDGTANFTHGIPLFGIQLALTRQDEPIVAAIGLPHQKAIYHAAKGKGAYRNDQKIKPSSTNTLSRATVSIGDYATGDGSEEKNQERLQVTAVLASRVERIRMLGSAAHDFAWVSDGRLDATIIMSNKAYDIAAGTLIATESGATVKSITGEPYTTKAPGVIACTPLLQEQLTELLLNRHL